MDSATRLFFSRFFFVAQLNIILHIFSLFCLFKVLFSPLPSLTLGDLLCLYAGPGSDSGVNEGLVSLYEFSFSFLFAHFLFRQILLCSPLGSWRLGIPTCSQKYLFLATLYHREPNPLLAPWIPRRWFPCAQS